MVRPRLGRECGRSFGIRPAFSHTDRSAPAAGGRTTFDAKTSLKERLPTANCVHELHEALKSFLEINTAVTATLLARMPRTSIKAAHASRSRPAHADGRDGLPYDRCTAPRGPAGSSATCLRRATALLRLGRSSRTEDLGYWVASPSRHRARSAALQARRAAAARSALCGT